MNTKKAINEHIINPTTKTARTVQVILTIATFMFTSYYIYSNKSDFKIILNIDKVSFISLSSFFFLTSFFNAAQNAVLIRSLGVQVSNLESFGVSNISAIVNLIVPQGLTITKAIYFKQRHKVSYSTFSALFLGLLVIFLLIGALIMTLMNLVAAIQGVKVPAILWISSFFGIASSMLFFFDFPKGSLWKIGKVGILLESFSDGWKELRSNKRCLIEASLWQVAIFISSGITVIIAYHSIGIDINPMLGISLSIFISYSNLIAIIPGNIGVQESIYGYLSYISGLMFVQGVVISALIRTIGLVITIFIAPLSWYFLFFRYKIKLR